MPVGPLEPIQQDSFSDSYLIEYLGATSEKDSSETHSMEKDASAVHREKFSQNPFDDPLEELSFNVTLEFCYTNSLGTDIYQDHVNRYAFNGERCIHYSQQKIHAESV